jgi:ATP adenylyltransferase/5',5'''-P-1,P-4-tetraphosphate phosphorylase II
LKDTITNIKTTKIIGFPNQNENKGCLIPNPNNEIKKTRTRHVQNKNPKRYYCKEGIEYDYDKKTYPKLLLNKLKVMGNSTFIYTYMAFSSRKFLKKLLTYMWPMCTHV